MLAVINNYPSPIEPKFQVLLDVIKSEFADISSKATTAKPKVMSVHYTKIIPEQFREFEAIISSGSTCDLPLEKYLFKKQLELIKTTTKPFLGICFGHELLGIAFGGRIRKISILKSDFEEIHILEDDPLFKPHRKGDYIILPESHHKIVKPTPEGFKILAETREHHIEIMKHPTKLAYGIQGHPERYTKEHSEGLTLLRNFLKMIKV